MSLKTSIVGFVVLVTLLAGQVSAYHIFGDGAFAGGVPGDSGDTCGVTHINRDVAASVAISGLGAGVTICSDGWWMGNGIALDGGPAPNDVHSGLVTCEKDHTTVVVDLPDASAGVGGRCSASSEDGPPGVPVPAWGTWTEMSVISGASAVGCGIAAGVQQMPYFARIGNDAHGILVPAGEQFYFREMLAILLDDGHVTYFLLAVNPDGSSNVGDQRTCYGDDDFVEAFAVGAVDFELCNDVGATSPSLVPGKVGPTAIFTNGGGPYVDPPAAEPDTVTVCVDTFP